MIKNIPTVAGGKWHPGNTRFKRKYKGDVKLHKYYTKDTNKNHTSLNRGESYYYIENHHEPIFLKRIGIRYKR